MRPPIPWLHGGARGIGCMERRAGDQQYHPLPPPALCPYPCEPCPCRAHSLRAVCSVGEGGIQWRLLSWRETTSDVRR